MDQIMKNEVWEFAATGDGAARDRLPCARWKYQLAVSGTGSVTAAATIQVRNRSGLPWVDLGTISASGTNSGTDSIDSDAPWVQHRAVLTGLTGTGAVAVVAAAGV